MENPTPISSFKTFLRSLILVTVIVAIAVVFFQKLVPSTQVGNYAWFLVAYFFIVTATFHYGLLKTTTGKPQIFVRYFMAATTFKLLIHLLVIVIYCMLFKSTAMPFVLSFFTLYILFSVFEVRQAMAIARISAPKK